MRSLFLLFLFLSPFVIHAQTLTVDDIYVGGPTAPVINIVGEKNTDTWFGLKDINFTWGLPEDTIAVATGLTTSSGIVPEDAHRPPISSITISADDLIEGEQFFSVQFRNSKKWGYVSERQLRIDGTSPEEFIIKVSSQDGEGGSRLSFEAVDTLSGIAYYDLYIDNARPTRLTPNEAKQGYFLVTNEGSHNIKVLAYDQALNSREASLVLVSNVIVPTSLAGNNILDIIVDEPVSVLAALMAGLMLLMFGYMVYERQRYASHLDDIQYEADEVQIQLLKIFSALREEIYDQIQAIDSKKRLSKQEKEAVTALNKALDVSEVLIDREIKDVQKLADE